MARMKTRLARLTADEQRFARNQDRLTELKTEQERLREDIKQAREQVFLDLARARGLTGLPVDQLQAAVEAAASVMTQTADAQNCDRQAEIVQSPVQEKAQVEIRASANLGVRKRRLVAGLTWNGKRGHYWGEVSAGRINELREAFGDRLAVIEIGDRHTDAAQDGGGLGEHEIEDPEYQPGSGGTVAV